MATDCIAQVRFSGDDFPTPVVARFDRPHASTDGGPSPGGGGRGVTGPRRPQLA